MRNLHKPRGRGYSLRVKTPDILVGQENPWTGGQFRKTITLGLGTRVHAEALRLRDIRLSATSKQFLTGVLCGPKFSGPVAYVSLVNFS